MGYKSIAVAQSRYSQVKKKLAATTTSVNGGSKVKDGAEDATPTKASVKRKRATKTLVGNSEMGAGKDEDVGSYASMVKKVRTEASVETYEGYGVAESGKKDNLESEEGGPVQP